MDNQSSDVQKKLTLEDELKETRKGGLDFQTYSVHWPSLVEVCKRYEQRLAEAEKKAFIVDAMKLYDEATDDAEFEPPHPIFQLAEERDNFMFQLKDALEKVTLLEGAAADLNRLVPFVESCLTFAGKQVDGNQLALRARALLTAAQPGNDPISEEFKWTFGSNRDSEWASLKVGEFKAFAQDCDGDFTTMRISCLKSKTFLLLTNQSFDEGGEYHFDIARRKLEKVVKALVDITPSQQEG